MHNLARVGLAIATALVTACVGGDARKGVPDQTTTTNDAADHDVPCSDNCAETIVPSCARAVWDATACECRLEPLADDTPCDDQDACTLEDRCSDGTCVGQPIDVARACDDGDPCTTDRCDPYDGCLSDPADGATCDDYNECTLDEVCTDGVCHWQTQYVCSTCSPDDPGACEASYGDHDACDGTLSCVRGFCEVEPASIVDCRDPRVDPCIDRHCDPATGACIASARDDGTPCIDGSPCTADDTCQDGVCQGTALTVAGCTCSSDDDCAALDDGDLCNGVFGCDDSGTCRFDFTSIVVCDASGDTACAAARCEPATGVCAPSPVREGEGCDDDDVCTVDDACQAGTCTGAPRDCSDLDGTCVHGACDPIVGCVVAPDGDGAPCDPHLRCVDSGECSDGACMPTKTACDDGDACTTDVCATSGECSHAGPPKPACKDTGVCAAGVPLSCIDGAYRCEYDDVAGYAEVEVCDGLDNDCDGDTDSGCVASLACADHSTLVGAFGDGAMQACQASDEGPASCGAGWHTCSYSQMLDALGNAPPPARYLIAASIAYDPTAGYSVVDRDDGACVEFQGLCSLGHQVQAVSWDGVFAGVVAYATEAWGCEGGVPAASCATADLDGVLCCGNLCAGSSDCSDDSPCTVDTCDLGRGRCIYTEKERPVCRTLGVCAGKGPVCGPLGTYACGYESDSHYEAVETSCDGLDNDCDGKTDALDPDLAGAGPACERGQGVCAGTKKPAGLCQDGRWLACSDATYLAHDPAYESSAETRCDGLDNDCDGGTDNTFAYAGAFVGAPCDGVGACGPGVVVCAKSGVAATCSTNADGPDSGATNEDCNGRDDDCDGATDEPEDLDATLAHCASDGVCRAGVPAECVSGEELGNEPGWRCDYEVIAEYHAVEHCDGLDDNCDGQTDEGFALEQPDGESLPLGAACGAAGSDCFGGRVVCDASGAGAVCSSDLGEANELCDGHDNDCNGQTDEGIAYFVGDVGYPLGHECPGRGACGPGLVECNASLAATCSTMPDGSASQATLERCNQIDDDCDGLTDDGMLYQGKPVGADCLGRGECKAGVVVCAANGSATCSTNPDGEDSQASPETCNGKDDDCDGTTDDGVQPGANDCGFRGVCTLQSGNFTCNGAGGWSCDFSQAPYFHAGNEAGLCDGRDNDCDGQTDEDFPTLGAACDGDDADLCKRGTFACKADGSGVSCSGDTVSVETCNGQDDDCDGQTDEPDALGCTTYFKDHDHDGFGIAGQTLCLCSASGNALVAGDCNDDNAQVNPGHGELCNGVDDDCDGATDAAGDAADLIVDDPRACENQVGVCGGAQKPASRCVGGVWQTCQAADYLARDPRFQPTEQSCDGADNDCDGKTDALDPDLEAQRPACANQAGVCQGALTPLAACTAAGWAPCSNAVYSANSPLFEPGQEVSCDGKDNDCDAQTDEPFTFGGKAVGQVCDGTGACGLGVVQCRADKTQATCSTNPDGTAPQAVPETCNGQDDDCDNQTDEQLGVLQSTCRMTGVCNADNVGASCTQGAWLCSYTNVPGYENGVELTCDGKDNDCDGQTDEDFVLAESGHNLHKGDPCGSGACLGAVICNAQTPAPGDLVCSSASGQVAEVCDGRDNDCDGQTDEDLVYRPPQGGSIPVGQACDGIGQCGAGTVVCSAGQVPTCSTNADGPAHQDVPEACNNLDDDCDGATDDGFSWNGLTLGKACDGVGACGAGTVECRSDASAATCSTNPDGSAHQNVAELCNGQDDDCDGQTDEGLGVLDSNCRLAGQCTQTNVVATCGGASGWSCDYKNVPSYHPNDETGFCDGLDNDCDGQTDEDFPELGQRCDGSDADLCKTGTWACPALLPGDAARGSPVCLGDTPTPELCNGVDDDCDGQTDEENAVDCALWFADADSDGWGDHANARCLCGPDPKTGHTSQSTLSDCDDAADFINPAADEVCDGLDDDCDGVTDNEGALGCSDFYFDGDHDDHGVDGDSRCLCDVSQGDPIDYTAELGDDCDDQDPTVFPTAPERCDGKDNDCDLQVDEGTDAIDCTVFYRDNDGDGYGGPLSQCLCHAGTIFRVTTPGDCCDSENKVHPGVSEYQTNPANSCANPWDFNCDNVVEQSITTRGSCTCAEGTGCGVCGLVQGWFLPANNPIPACGNTGSFLNKCSRVGAVGTFACTPGTRSEKQGCR